MRFISQGYGKVQKCKSILIDDLFKGKVTESDINIMFELLNFRYFNKLPVIVSCEWMLIEF